MSASTSEEHIIYSLATSLSAEFNKVQCDVSIADLLADEGNNVKLMRIVIIF